MDSINMAIYEKAMISIDAFKVTNKLNDIELKELVEDLTFRYKYESLDTIVLFFDKLKRGEYGSGFNRIDLPIIYEAWNKYIYEVIQEKEIKSERLQDEFNINAKNVAQNLDRNKLVVLGMKPKRNKCDAEILDKIKEIETQFNDIFTAMPANHKQRCIKTVDGKNALVKTIIKDNNEITLDQFIDIILNA